MRDVKYRHELKYVISSRQMAVLKSRISGIMKPDLHRENGMYNISSVYFDDLYNRCYYENENGTDPREKFRIRIYNHSNQRISLELKRKERGKTLKLSCPLSARMAQRLIDGDSSLTVREENPRLVNRLITEIKQNKMRGVVIVEYDRIPYIYANGNVRVTFDTNISSSPMTKQFFAGSYAKRPVMPTGQQILEVKYDEYLPDVIYRALQIENLQQTAYSKYYLCRKYKL